MKILYLCSQNKQRSLTAEKVLNGINDHQVRSAGTESNARVKVTEGLLGWADVIVTMEKKHTRRILEKYQDTVNEKSVICLYIPDEYLYMDEDLIDILNSSFDEVVEIDGK